MQAFIRVYWISLERLLKNWYVIFFTLLTVFPILTTIFLRLNPESLVTHNPHYANPVVEQPISPQNPESQQIPQNPPTTSEQDDPLFGPRQIVRTWEEVLLGVTYYFLVGSIAVLAMASLGSRMIANEVEFGTLQLLFLRPIGRCSIYLAKYSALVTTGVILFTPAMFLIYGIALWENWHFSTLFYDFSILFLAIMAYSSLFLFLSIFQEGLYISLGYAIFWEIFIGFITERARTFAISYYVRSLYYTLFFDPGKFPDYDVIATWHAVSMLLGISVFFLIIGISFFRKQEFNFC